jgi:RES domain-containing protein
LQQHEPLADEPPGKLRLYKWMRDVDAEVYAPNSPHPSSVSRFCDGTFPSLYLAETAEGAMAEFFRNSPSFLAQQAGLKIRLFSINVEVLGPAPDLRSHATCAALEIDPARVVSNDANSTVRWAECQAVARLVRAGDGVGLLYPSAAYLGTWNLVLFDWPSPTTWSTGGYADEPAPYVDPNRVSLISRQ